MWIAAGICAGVIVSTPWMVKWFAQRELRRTERIIDQKLAEFKCSLPDEFEAFLDQLQICKDNNKDE